MISYWKFLDFDKTLVDVTAGNTKIQKKDYNEKGLIPIIDQGQEYAAGYTNNEDLSFKGELPVIVFGDHTRIIKYVNERFCLGADGVRVLKPKNYYEAKFLYYYLNYSEIPNKGYTRHFKFLKEKQFPYLAPSEQRRIVEILDQADEIRKLRKQADEKAEKIIPSLFYEMFGDIKSNPHSFKKNKIGEVLKVKSGNLLTSAMMDKDGEYPVYGGNGINGYHNKYMFEESKIVIGRVGAYCGNVFYSQPKCWITDNALYVTEKTSDLLDEFLVYQLKVLNLNQYAGRAGQPLVSGNRIYPIEIIIPDKGLQTNFVKRLNHFESAYKSQKLSNDKISNLFEVLLSKAFDGSLTASWREVHMKELLQEMEEQKKYLEKVN